MLYFDIWTNGYTKRTDAVSVRHCHQYNGGQSWSPWNPRWDQVTGEVSVYWWVFWTCNEYQRHRKRHTKWLHEIIEIGSIGYLNISRACAGHFLVLSELKPLPAVHLTGICVGLSHCSMASCMKARPSFIALAENKQENVKINKSLNFILTDKLLTSHS